MLAWQHTTTLCPALRRLGARSISSPFMDTRWWIIWYVVPFSENDAHCVCNEKQKKYDVGHCQSSEAPVRSHSGVTLVSELISGKRAEQTEESHSEVGWLALSHNLLQERWKLVGSIQWSLIFSPEVSHISPSLCQCQCMRPPSPFVIWTAVCCTKYFFFCENIFTLRMTCCTSRVLPAGCPAHTAASPCLLGSEIAGDENLSHQCKSWRKNDIYFRVMVILCGHFIRFKCKCCMNLGPLVLIHCCSKYR